MKSRLKHIKIRSQFMLAILILAALITVSFSSFFYALQKNKLIEGIDSKLYTAALMARQLLPADYHDRIFNKNSVSLEEYESIVTKYNQICKSLDLEYLWSLMQIDGKIVFTSATSPDKITENKKYAGFFEIHSNPELYVSTFLKMTPTYQTNNDKWGDIRVVLIPFKDISGRPYLFGASMSLAKVNSQLKNILLYCILIGFSIFLTSIIISYFFAVLVTRPIKNLAETIKNNMDKKILMSAREEGSYEQVMLTKNFNLLIQELDNKITELAEKEESLQVTLHSIGDGVISTDKEGKVMQINFVAQQLTGWKSKEVFGKYFNEIFNIVSGTDGGKLKDPVKEVLLTGEVCELENHTVLISKDGTKRHIADSAAPIKNKDGNINGVVIIFRDVTERKQTEKALKSSEARFRSMFEQAPLGIALTDSLTGNVYEVNARYAEITGRTKEELANIGWMRITNPDDIKKDLDSMALLNSGKIKIVKMNKRYIRPDGSNVWVNMTIVPIGVDDKLHPMHLCMIEDITENKKQEEKLRYLSFHDGLTGLYNRAYFEEELLRLDTKRQLPLGLIMGDLNGLKIINDTFGHSEGDKILKETAELLKKVCRSDDILARWGGDEFVILLPKTSTAGSEEIVQRIKEECSKLIIQKIPLGLALGIATKIEVKQDIDKIIVEAESNMYKNKLAQKESNASSIILALEQTLYEKSNETMEHASRIKDNAIKLGKSIKLHPHQLDELSLLASLHDIGKVAIPETILLKEGKLTEKEWTVIKRHPEIGFNIAQSSPQIVHVAKFILACHENWDGSGYPKGLGKEAIPIVSRIVSIADAYDVMTSERSYKKSISKDEAIKELKRCAGTQFDPVLVEKFIEILSG